MKSCVMSEPSWPSVFRHGANTPWARRQITLVAVSPVEVTDIMIGGEKLMSPAVGCDSVLDLRRVGCHAVVGFLIALWLIWVLLRWVVKKLAAAFRRK